MTGKIIITVAPTGNIPTKKDNPHLPISPEEMAEETRRSYEAGASIVHIHARDPNTQVPTTDVGILRGIVDAIRSKCPIITQISTSGSPGEAPEERLRPIEEILPDSASLNTGSMNFGRKLFINTPDVMELFAKRMNELGVMPEFEIYDLSMVQSVDHWIRKPGILMPPYRFSFVMGVMGGIPATVKNLITLVESAPSDYGWQVIGIGRHQIPLGAAAALLGGGIRVGFEDNVYLTKGVLAKSNAELVEKAGRVVRELGFEVATVEEARSVLPLLNKESVLR